MSIIHIFVFMSKKAKKKSAKKPIPKKDEKFYIDTNLDEFLILTLPAEEQKKIKESKKD